MDKKAAFINKIRKEFPVKNIRVLQYMYDKPPVTFRVNTKKISEKEVLQMLRKEGFLIKPGPLKNSYIVNASKKRSLSETELFNEGYIYIQRLSSMLPAFMIEPEEGDKILDMCAAPGSKTSQMALMSNEKAEIVAVDINRKRYYKLKSNLENQGVNNVEIINYDSTKLPKKYHQFINYFDKILLDAPCSNEGLICLSDEESIERWNPKVSKKLAKVQKRLVASALKMLAPGGTLVYSTCTFSKTENEDIIVWVLRNYKNVTMMEQKKIIPDGQFTGFFAVKFRKLN